MDVRGRLHATLAIPLTIVVPVDDDLSGWAATYPDDISPGEGMNRDCVTRV